MTQREIENYLVVKRITLDSAIGDEIEKQRQEAIIQQREGEANYFWCLLQIYEIQKGYISAINLLKTQKYEDAWCLFDRVDIKLSFLEENFDSTLENDKYHMGFIGRMIKEYQKLFPYRHFFSRECIIKAEKCSICGKPISLRNTCGHKAGKLYMGELCLREVIDIEFNAISIVTDPFDKYTYVQLPGQEYDYGMLEALMVEIDEPYDEFYIETIKVIKPEYKDVKRNSLCPCNSGKKYKKCHQGTSNELMDHHIIHMTKSTTTCNRKFVGTFSTWK